MPDITCALASKVKSLSTNRSTIWSVFVSRIESFEMAQGKGRIVGFSHVPQLQFIRARLIRYFDLNCTLQAEGNILKPLGE
jgi:hypothetical protein